MLGDLHPAINWADKESHVDPDEMAKVMQKKENIFFLDTNIVYLLLELLIVISICVLSD
jgi:hypothetical protein